jgi:ADP-ribose pyrophosphatase
MRSSGFPAIGSPPSGGGAQAKLSAVPPEQEIKRGFSLRVNRERATLPDGRRVDLDIVRHPGAAAVVPFVGPGEVLLIRQYRHAAGGMILEVPAGKLDAGEPPERCAARELEEEAGFRAGRLEPLGWIWTTPGFCDERIFLFAAFDLEPVGANRSADEYIETLHMPLAEALALVWRGELPDAKSALALVHAARSLGHLR